MPLHLHHGAARRIPGGQNRPVCQLGHGFFHLLVVRAAEDRLGPIGFPGQEGEVGVRPLHQILQQTAALHRKDGKADQDTDHGRHRQGAAGRFSSAGLLRGGGRRDRRDLWERTCGLCLGFHGRYLPGAEGIPRGVHIHRRGGLGRSLFHHLHDCHDQVWIGVVLSRGEILLEQVFQRLGGELFQPGVLSQLVFGIVHSLEPPLFSLCRAVSLFLQGGSEKCSISRYIF